MTARQIDVSDPVAHLHELDHGCIGNLRAVAQVNIMQVLSQPCDCVHRFIRDVLALGEHKIPQPGRCFDDFLHSFIVQLVTSGQVQDTQAVKGQMFGQLQEGVVSDQATMGNSEFSQLSAPCNQRCDGFIGDLPAIMQINLEHRRAMASDGGDGLIGDQGTVVQFQLQCN